MNEKTTTLQDINLDALLSHVYAHSTSLSSHLHGESHWLRVAKVGLELARQTPDCDLTVIYLFGLLHDTQRLSEGRDPEHGERASEFAQKLNNQYVSLAPDQLETLTYACYEHDKGKVSDDPTIGLCWDADRLNLWRVGIIPKRKYLSSEIAKQWTMRFKTLHIQAQSFTWQELIQQYIALSDKKDN